MVEEAEASVGGHVGSSVCHLRPCDRRFSGEPTAPVFAVFAFLQVRLCRDRHRDMKLNRFHRWANICYVTTSAAFFLVQSLVKGLVDCLLVTFGHSRVRRLVLQPVVQPFKFERGTS